MRKGLWIAGGILLILATAYIILPGCMKVSDGYIADYAVSAEGESMWIRVGKASSAGYIRRVNVRPQQGNRVYLDCYAAFGGINGSLGAKDEYTVAMDADAQMILLYRAPDCYEPVLEKDGNGEWRRVKETLE